MQAINNKLEQIRQIKREFKEKLQMMQIKEQNMSVRISENWNNREWDSLM